MNFAIREGTDAHTLARFFRHVSIPPKGRNHCWLWTGAKRKDGYGAFGIMPGKTVLAHRFSFAFCGGDQNAEVVCHRCDTPSCVNPSHLFAGTHKINVRDSMTKGRRAKGTKHGMRKLDDEQVLAIRHRFSCGEAAFNIARTYGVARTTIFAVVTRQTWRHLP